MTPNRSTEMSLCFLTATAASAQSVKHISFALTALGPGPANTITSATPSNALFAISLYIAAH